MAEFAIGTRMVGDGHAPLVVAELGVNHLGSVRIARDMIKAAADAGAECVKGQCHTPDEHVADLMPANVRDTITRCSMSADDERDLCEYARSLGLIYISTPFSVAAADRLHALDLPAYKIGSGELTNLPLIEHVASFGKSVILSTGMAGLHDVLDARDLLGGVPHAYLHCVSVYPTPPRFANLMRIEELQINLGVVGISDHSQGIGVAVAAAAYGAHIIEKHFTLSHDLECPDAVVSIDPRELETLIVSAAQAWETRLYDGRRPKELEAATAAWAHHSVTLRRAVKAGETLTVEHLTCKRPAGGLPASKLRACVGRVAARDMSADTQVREADLA